ncbi:PPE family protein [Mycobacterium kansasii]|uniref:PPE family protein n=4 Tax=Mycobacterium kansasii TaxID=1768 RepID=A0A1V3WWP5_MYCKA|nr:PPE family protein [Mycobacterium kansasii]EUA04662.1 PPE family protein [Mycobacterium kansasii 824]AGZ51623.1 hypothetical protein MKAN_16110 [Mycobacterium kansasii ATCC 12478]ARG56639.1 PPE family protein [Mycobacterium kansasii]ARG62159.1 PPE family protein [Mycobacterium kansasii]ARG69782.1 PPE family protein [Mycobacterium kansasii]
MNALVDFARLPPEITSARLRSGAGAAPLRAAALAWKGLAHELSSHALAFGSTVSALVDDEWRGPASVSMAAAAEPYRKWISATADHARQTAVQADAAAAAYDDVLTQTVPPSIIRTNRARRIALSVTNLFGQHTPAIAVLEAQYADMWAQNATAMYSYAALSAEAATLTPFMWLRPITNPSGSTLRSAMVAEAAGKAGAEHAMLARLTSALPAALREFSSPAAHARFPARRSRIDDLLSGSGWLKRFWNNWGPDANIWNTIFSSGFYMPSNTLAPFLGFLGGAAAADHAADAGASGAAGVLAGPSENPARLRAWGANADMVSAALGRAAAIGPLSVPPTWTAVGPTTGRLAAMSVATPMTTPPVESGLPEMPLGGVLSGNGQGPGRSLPQYGFRPTVVARPPAGG